MSLFYVYTLIEFPFDPKISHECVYMAKNYFLETDSVKSNTFLDSKSFYEFFERSIDYKHIIGYWDL